MQKITFQWINNNPLSKLIIALIFSVAILFINSIPCLLALAGLSLLFCVIARVAPSFMLKRMALANIFMAMVWLALPWQLLIGHNGWTLQFLPAKLWLALAITLKCNAIFLCWMSLLWRTGLPQFLQALASLGLSSKLLTLFFLFCRFVWLIRDEYLQLRLAMRARGFTARFRPHTLRALSQLIATLLARAFDRAEKVHNAMLGRGFNGKLYFLNDEQSWQGKDSLILLISLTSLFLPISILA